MSLLFYVNAFARFSRFAASLARCRQPDGDPSGYGNIVALGWSQVVLDFIIKRALIGLSEGMYCVVYIDILSSI